MSDWLVQVQDWLAQYPTWVVAGAIGFAVVILVVLAWKALRLVVTGLIVAALVAGAWFVWESITDRDATEASPAVAPADDGP